MADTIISKAVEKELLDRAKTAADLNNNIFNDFKEQTKYNTSKFEDDLYHEEDHIAAKVIRFKRFSLPNKEECWKFFEDNRILLVIEGKRFTKKEREFLRTVDGVSWALVVCKRGISSVSAFKKELKLKLKG
jgi:hypothetical protein